MPLSPTCTIGGSATPATVSASASVTGALANPTGAAFWFLKAISCDEVTGLMGLATINASLVINQTNKTFSFTAPGSLGTCVIFQSTVGVSSLSALGAGRDVNGTIQPSYTTTFKVNVAAANGNIVMGASEVTEQDPAFGWIAIPNQAARTAGGSGGGGNTVTLDATSAAVTAGDTGVSASAASSSNLVRAVAGTVANAPTVTGIFLASAGAGATNIPFAPAGAVVPAAITGLGVGAAAVVQLNLTTGRLARVSGSPSGLTIVGSCDTQGNVTVAPQPVVSSGGGGGGGNQGQFNTTIVAGLNSNLATTGLSYLTLGFGSNTPGPFSLGGFSTTASTKDGLLLTIRNTTAFPCTIVEEDASSTAANRISFGRLTTNTAPYTLGPYGGQVTMTYDTSSSRWVVVAGNWTYARDIDARDAGLIAGATGTNARKISTLINYAASLPHCPTVRVGGVQSGTGATNQYYLEEPIVIQSAGPSSAGMTLAGENDQGGTSLRAMFMGPAICTSAPSTQPCLVQDGTFWALQFREAGDTPVFYLNETSRGTLNGLVAYTIEGMFNLQSTPLGAGRQILNSNGRRGHNERSTSALTLSIAANQRMTLILTTSNGQLTVSTAAAFALSTRTKFAFSFDGVTLRTYVAGAFDTASSAIGTSLNGHVAVTNGSTLVQTTALQVGCIAAGQQVAFASQSGTPYTIAAVQPTASGTFTLTANSATVACSVSQVGLLFVGQEIQFSQQYGTYYQISAVTGGGSPTITLSIPYTGTGGSGFTARILCEAGMLPLHGTFGVIEGNSTVSTTSSQVGIVIGGQQIKFTNDSQTYQVASVSSSSISLTAPFSSSTGISCPVVGAAASCFVLTSAYSGTTNASTTAMRQLLGTFTTVTSSNSVATTSSQVGVLTVNQQIQFASQAAWYTITAISASTLTLSANYTGAGSTTDTATPSPTIVQSRYEEYVLGGNVGDWPIGTPISPVPNALISSVILSDNLARYTSQAGGTPYPPETNEITTCSDAHFQLLINFDPNNWYPSTLTSSGTPNVIGVTNGSATVSVPAPGLPMNYQANMQVQFASQPGVWYPILTAVQGATTLTLSTPYTGTTNANTTAILAGATGLLKTLCRNDALGFINLPAWYLMRSSAINQMSGPRITGFQILPGYTGVTGVMGYLCTYTRISSIHVEGCQRGIVLDNNCYLSTVVDCVIGVVDAGAGHSFGILLSNATGICYVARCQFGGGQYCIVTSGGEATWEDLYPVVNGAGAFFIKSAGNQGTQQFIDCVPGDETGQTFEHCMFLSGGFGHVVWSNTQTEVATDVGAKQQILLDASTGFGTFVFNGSVQGTQLRIPAFSFLSPPTKPVMVIGSQQDLLLNGGLLTPWVDTHRPGPVMLMDQETWGRGGIVIPTDADYAMTDVNAQMWGYIQITSAVSLTNTRTVTLPIHMMGKQYTIRNATTGGQSINVACPGGTTVTLAAAGSAGSALAIYDDGTNLAAA